MKLADSLATRRARVERRDLTEVDGSAGFGPAGPLGDGEMVANAFVPVHEPTGVLALGAAGLLALRRRRR